MIGAAISRMMNAGIYGKTVGSSKGRQLSQIAVVSNYGRALGNSILGRSIGKAVERGLESGWEVLEDTGRDAVVDAVGGIDSPLGLALDTLLEIAGQTHAASRREVIKSKAQSAAERRRHRQAHQEWLADNRWRFDWRSQPRQPAGRPEGGEWMEGRLDYPVAKANPISRAVRQRRTQAVRAYKARRLAMGEKNTRTIRSSWGDF